jgi:peptidoglycan/xylan/chitin deacetylase (PgdA/CDA1 family)
VVLGPAAHAALNLLYHYVAPAGSGRRQAISPDALGARLVALRATRPTTRLSDYFGVAPPPGAFTVSFDDAHRSVLEHAVPVLPELVLTATLFVPTGYVGTSDELLDWDGLRA